MGPKKKNAYVKQPLILHSAAPIARLSSWTVVCLCLSCLSVSCAISVWSMLTFTQFFKFRRCWRGHLQHAAAIYNPGLFMERRGYSFTPLLVYFITSFTSWLSLTKTHFFMTCFITDWKSHNLCMTVSHLLLRFEVSLLSYWSLKRPLLSSYYYYYLPSLLSNSLNIFPLSTNWPCLSISTYLNGWLLLEFLNKRQISRNALWYNGNVPFFPLDIMM